MPSQSYIESEKRRKARKEARESDPYIRSPAQFKREIEQLEFRRKAMERAMSAGSRAATRTSAQRLGSRKY